MTRGRYSRPIAFSLAGLLVALLALSATARGTNAERNKKLGPVSEHVERVLALLGKGDQRALK